MYLADIELKNFQIRLMISGWLKQNSRKFFGLDGSSTQPLMTVISLTGILRGLPGRFFTSGSFFSFPAAFDWSADFTACAFDDACRASDDVYDACRASDDDADSKDVAVDEDVADDNEDNNEEDVTVKGKSDGNFDAAIFVSFSKLPPLILSFTAADANFDVPSLDKSSVEAVFKAGSFLLGRPRFAAGFLSGFAGGISLSSSSLTLFFWKVTFLLLLSFDADGLSFDDADDDDDDDVLSLSFDADGLSFDDDLSFADDDDVLSLSFEVEGLPFEDALDRDFERWSVSDSEELSDVLDVSELSELSRRLFLDIYTASVRIQIY